MCVTADSADEDGYDSLLPVELPVSEVYLHMDTNETLRDCRYRSSILPASAARS